MLKLNNGGTSKVYREQRKEDLIYWMIRLKYDHIICLASFQKCFTQKMNE
jgi:hypothetical protein